MHLHSGPQKSATDAPNPHYLCGVEQQVLKAQDHCYVKWRKLYEQESSYALQTGDSLKKRTVLSGSAPQ